MDTDLQSTLNTLTFDQAKQNLEAAGFPQLTETARQAGNTSTPQTTPNIDVSDINSPQAQPFKVPEDATPQSQAQQLEDQIRSLAAVQTNETIDNTENLLTILGERAADIQLDLGDLPAERAALEEESGLRDLERQRSDVFAQAQKLQASLAKGVADEEGRVVPMGVITGRQAQMRRQAAAELAGLSAISSALEGQISTAQSYINQQIDIKYSALEGQLNAINTTIDLNKDKLTREEARLAEQRQTEIKLAMDELDRKKQDEQIAKNIVLEQLSNGGMPSSIANKILSQEGDLSTDVLLQKYGAYLQDPNAIISLQLKNIEMQKAQAELSALQNPPEGLSPALIKKIEGLSDGKRNDLINANTTTSQINQLISMIQTTDDLSRLNPTTEEGRKFKRIALDVADKMARERTGAVVSDDEIKTFKTILGLSFGSQLLADDTELVQNLNQFKNKHQQTVSLIDPTGDIVNYLDTAAPVDSVEDTETGYVDSIVEGLSGTGSPYDFYLNNR